MCNGREVNAKKYICIDIWRLIMEYIEFIDKIRIIRINTETYSNLKIYDLYDISYLYLSKLTDNILKQNIYRDVAKLNLYYTSNVTDINHLKQIDVLDISINPYIESGINNNGIRDLNPKYLNIDNNINITNINHMSNLIELEACGTIISFGGICKLNLKKIYIYRAKITKEMFMGYANIAVIEYTKLYDRIQSTRYPKVSVYLSGGKYYYSHYEVNGYGSYGLKYST